MDRSTLEARVGSFPRWHYEFDLDGVTTPIFDRSLVNRHRQRRKYFFDPLVGVCGGSLKGKRVLDLGCNAGFWSLCAIESGCDFVLGLDARPMHIDQANLVFEVKGVDRDRYRFVQGNVFETELSKEPQFDIVLCLGLMYHVSKPMSLMEAIAGWNSDLLIIDTSLSRAPGRYLEIRHENRDDPRAAADYDLVLYPTRKAVIELARAFEYSAVTLRPRFTSYEGSRDYRTGLRRAFLCSRRTSLGADALPVERPGLTRELVDASAWAYAKARSALRRGL